MMSVEINAPALIPPPMMKWSRVKSDDLAEVVIVVSLLGVSVVVRVLVELEVEVVVPVCPLGELGFPFVAVEPLLLPLLEFVDELFVVPVVVVSVVVEFVVVLFFTTVDCENAIPTVSSTMQIADNIFLIFLYIDS